MCVIKHNSTRPHKQRRLEAMTRQMAFYVIVVLALVLNYVSAMDRVIYVDSTPDGLAVALREATGPTYGLHHRIIIVVPPGVYETRGSPFSLTPGPRSSPTSSRHSAPEATSATEIVLRGAGPSTILRLPAGSRSLAVLRWVQCVCTHLHVRSRGVGFAPRVALRHVYAFGSRG